MIDLDATFGRSDGEDDEEEEPVVSNLNVNAAPLRKKKQANQELDADGNPINNDDDDDDDEQANMSLAAMEAALKPRVLETLDLIARDLRPTVGNAGPADVGDPERGRIRSLQAKRAPIRSCAPRSLNW